MTIQTVVSTEIPEKTTPKLTAVLEDENGVVISSASLDTLTLTLYKKYDVTTIINSRNNQNVLNTNNITVDTSGNLTWLMQIEDNIISDSGESSEEHVARFDWTYSSGTKAGRHEILITVINLLGVT